MTPAIELRSVHKAFGDNRVLQGVSLAVAPHETFVLLGRSGAGKTVVLKLIEGLLHPDAGEVLLEGHDLSTANTRELLELRGLLGIQFQSGASPRSLSRAFARSLPAKVVETPLRVTPVRRETAS
jgi:phospholipid/cholesterol/gamma-HCH transport system ATP-binding protein